VSPAVRRVAEGGVPGRLGGQTGYSNSLPVLPPGRRCRRPTVRYGRGASGPRVLVAGLRCGGDRGRPGGRRSAATPAPAGLDVGHPAAATECSGDLLVEFGAGLPVSLPLPSLNVA
jgi:hypothetical protein